LSNLKTNLTNANDVSKITKLLNYQITKFPELEITGRAASIRLTFFRLDHIPQQQRLISLRQLIQK
jgi:hypothetical protein